jgi:flagellin
MSFSVNTNSNALAALYTLGQTQRGLTETQNRINSGFKIGSAKDNASTFAIAQGMRGDIAGLKAVQDSLNIGQTTVNVAANAAQTISDKLNQLKNLVTQGQDPTADKNAIQNNINATISTINSIANAAQFNGVNLLNSTGSGLNVVSSLNRTSSSSVTVANINVAQQDLTAATIGVAAVNITTGSSSTFTQAAGIKFANKDTVSLVTNNAAGNAITYTFEVTDGSGPLTTATTTTNASNAATGTIAVAVVSDPATDTPQQTFSKMFTAMRQSGFTVQSHDDGSFDVYAANGLTGTPTATGTVAGSLTATAPGSAASGAMTTVENAINSVKTALAQLGTAQNQLQAQGDFVKSLTDSLTTGVGTLVDADLAEESANLQALQTKQQLGIQALSIANQSTGAVLSLFR